MSSVIDAAGSSAGRFAGVAVTGMQWSAVFYAIRQWVLIGSGLAPAQVIWSEQNSPRPTGQYIELRITDEDRRNDWYDRVFDPNTQTVTQYIRAAMTGTLTITCFAGAPDGAAPEGQRGPTQVLTDVLAAASKESVIATMVKYKVGIGTWDKIRNTGGVINTARFEPRAMVSARIHLTSEIIELSGWIETLDATGVAPGDATGTNISVTST